MFSLTTTGILCFSFSFFSTGHLAGILVGLLYVKGPLKSLMDTLIPSGLFDYILQNCYPVSIIVTSLNFIELVDLFVRLSIHPSSRPSIRLSDRPFTFSFPEHISETSAWISAVFHANYPHGCAILKQ